MTTELRYDVATIVSHSDPNGLVPTSASLVLRRADGSILQSPTVSCPTVSTTTAAGSTKSVLVVASAAGLMVGESYALVSGGVTAVVRIARIEGTSITLAAALDVAPANGSALSALRMTATVTAPGAGAVAPNYHLEWTYEDEAGQTGSHHDTAHVVRWRWDPPITPAGVRAIIASNWPSLQRNQVYYQDIADAANDRIRQLVEATNKRPYLYGDPSVFREPGKIAARILLADDGYLPPGASTDAYSGELNDRFRDLMKPAISSLAVYDADDNGVISTQEARGNWFSFRVRR